MPALLLVTPYELTNWPAVGEPRKSIAPDGIANTITCESLFFRGWWTSSSSDSQSMITVPRRCPSNNDNNGLDHSD